MKTTSTPRVFVLISFLILFIQSQNEAYASHAQSADITYQCLGGNQYQISLSFYRDCAGVAAPNTAQVDISSASCGQNLSLTLNRIQGTGIEVSPICSQMNTQCSGGQYPGVQEYIFRGNITLPAQCTDWVISFSLCCRNSSIGTITNPGSENIYVEARLNNLNFTCNNSPTFSNPPIPFVCVGQPYCFNNGSFDADGDSLFYTLVAPWTSATTNVNYISPYSESQPLASSPAVSFNPTTGDMCMTPTQLQVTVFAVIVQEWRNGVFVGSVMRDIQLRTITCTNNNPYVNGINNTNQYSLTACAGQPINFTISSFDIDTTQNVTINWNSGISNANFSSSAGSRPTATFSWTPTAADISNASHCFTVTVQDDNCPYNGSQTFSFCIIVTGITATTTTTNANCGAANGTAAVQVISGSGPFTYQWLPNGGSSAAANGLQAGTYTVTVNSPGCNSSFTATVGNGATPGFIQLTSVNVTCYNGSNGSIVANVNGGQQPYSYLWSNGFTTPTITNLVAGTYTLTVTTANGCISTSTTTITQPSSPIGYTSSQTNATCANSATGSATVNPTGGTAPFIYIWNTSPAQSTATAINLIAGSTSAIISDVNGCSITANFTITEPPALTSNAMIVSGITCNGASNGNIIVGGSGGTGMYTYEWNTNPIQYSQNIMGLPPGNYTATITDANGCSSTSTAVLTEPNPLTLSTAGFAATCNGFADGQAVVIPSGGTPTYTYQWLPNGGTGASANGLSAGTYVITVTDNNGCHVSSNVAITQPAPLTIVASNSTSICLGQNTQLTASATGGNGNYVFNWTGVGTGPVQIVSPTTSTIYDVTATDANGCISNTETVAINVTSLTAANLLVTPSTSICNGNNATLSATVSGNTGPVTINWSNNLGIGNGPFTVSPNTNTTYTVTVTDACNNSITSTIPITVNQLPTIDVSPVTGIGCGEVAVYFQDNSPTNTGAQYSWVFGDGTSSSVPTPTHTYTQSGNYTINVMVTSSAGCSNSQNTTATVIVHSPSKALFTAEAIDGTTVSPVYKFLNSSINAATYTWSFGDGTNSSVYSPVHSYIDKGEYLVTLHVSSSEGCKDSLTIPVEIKPIFTIYIPNAFTPDGSGINDYFSAKGQEISEFKMMIFNRWGDLIFQTNYISKGWDGRANGGSEIAQDGVYVYKIEVRDFQSKYHDYMGHVTLLANR
jgi:gliding motility-associated-like protein